MVHCLLPRAAAAAGSMPEAEALRYVDTAIELMLTAFARIGVVPAEIETKLFGGADRIHRGNPNHGYRVGRRNIEAALEVLRGRGIVPAVLEVGGRNGRVIDFDTATGLVMVRRLPCDAAGESL